MPPAEAAETGRAQQSGQGGHTRLRHLDRRNDGMGMGRHWAAAGLLALMLGSFGAAPLPVAAQEGGAQSSLRPKARPAAPAESGEATDEAPAPDDTPAPAEATPPLAAPAAATAPAPEPAATPVAAKPKVPPRDPNRGAVTNLPLPRFVSLKGKEGNARRGPGLTHRIDWVFVRAGMPLKITAEYEHWRRIEDAEGAGGWVHYALLSGVRSAQVVADTADFHSAPSDASPVIFKAEKDVVGWIQACEPDWCRLSVEGEKGWVRKAALWGVEAGEIIE